MSLRIWLPLTKDLRNQGLDDVTVTNNGATFNSAGKLGGCYSFDGSDDFISLNGSALYDIIKGGSTPFSITMWVYHADSTRAILFGDYSLSGAINFNIELNASHSVRFYWAGSPDTSGGHTLATLSTWTHIAIIYDGAKINFYMNGELKDTYTGVLSTKTKTSGMYYIGRDSRTGTTAFNGKLNDFRIYDHALSQMEVKELSKGLVLHYPLNRQGWGQENLAKNTNGVIIDGLGSTPGSRHEYYAFNCGTPFSVNAGDTVTISFDLYETVNTAGSGYLYVYNTNNKGPHQIAGVNVLAGRIIAVGDIIDERISFTTTVSNRSDATQTNDFIEFYSNYGTSNWFKISNLKVEKGSIATPWCPNSADILATTMGLNSTTEYDCSGFCNNGIWHGTHTNTSDTPKYAVSTTATGSGTTYLEGPVLPAEAKTVALWIKNTSKSSNGAIFNDKTTGLQIGLLNSLLYMNSKASTAGFTTTHWVNGEWNHVVAINNDGTRSLYVNGQPETQSGASNYYIHNADNCWLWNRSYNNSYPFTGSLCDLRVYATALSASDVKSLYQNCATIDPDGTIRGQIRS